ncbi:MAG TPA: hypothetical protein VNG53_02375 [Bacteroidia bacterium]|nr:hypothetical protein [Bacteroidia bacterium]
MAQKKTIPKDLLDIITELYQLDRFQKTLLEIDKHLGEKNEYGVNLMFLCMELGKQEQALIKTIGDKYQKR